MTPLQERIENIRRTANPQAYIRQDTEKLLETIKKIELPEINNEIHTYKKVLGKKKYKETEKIEAFELISNVFNECYQTMLRNKCAPKITLGYELF